MRGPRLTHKAPKLTVAALLVVMTTLPSAVLVIEGGMQDLAAAANSSTVTVTSSVMTIPANQHVNDKVFCPAGTTAIGGGGQTDSQSVLTSNGPLLSGQFLSSVGDGSHPSAALNGWNVSAAASSNAQGTIVATVICAQAGGMLAASYTLQVASANLPQASGVTVDATCSSGQEAVGGGMDASNSTYVFFGNDEPLLSGGLPASGAQPGTYGAPTGWRGDGYNNHNVAETVKTGAICVALGAVPNLSTVVATQATNVPVNAACPGGAEVTDGGAGTLPTAGFVQVSNPTGASAGGPASSWTVDVLPGEPRVASVVCLVPTTPATTTTPPTTSIPPGTKTVTRLAGPDRIATAIAVSHAAYPGAGSAGAVVLARADDFPDALAGAPLAAKVNAPVLLTTTTTLDPATENEIKRVLGAGKTVYVLGGDKAIDPTVANALIADGYTVVRYAGPTRFDTALVIADKGLSNPTKLLVATGLNFPDALAGGPAATTVGAAIVLTSDATMPPATAAYISAHPNDTRYALGGQAAAADPGATPVAGPNRYETAVAVAATFFTTPAAAGVASGTVFADALPAGPHIGGLNGPLLLSDGVTLPASAGSYLNTHKASIGPAFVYGGTVRISDNVKNATSQALS
ncbi:MAG: cell wall-binding repeat-containing protein [Acidimicrobiales bacterium]